MKSDTEHNFNIASDNIMYCMKYYLSWLYSIMIVYATELPQEEVNSSDD